MRRDRDDGQLLPVVVVSFILAYCCCLVMHINVRFGKVSFYSFTPPWFWFSGAFNTFITVDIIDKDGNARNLCTIGLPIIAV